MSYDDGKDKNGNFINGIPGIDAFGAGVNPTDSLWDATDKVENEKSRILGERLRSGAGSANSSVPGTQRRRTGTFRVFLFSLICISLIAYFFFYRVIGVIEARYPDTSDAIPIVRNLGYIENPKKLTSAEKNNFWTEKFRLTYGTLFTDNVPLNGLFKTCTNNDDACENAFHARLEALRPYALKPATFMEDMCENNARAFYGENYSKFLNVAWRIEYLKENTRNFHACKIYNQKEYNESIKNKTIYSIAAYFAGSVIAAFLSVALLKRYFKNTK